MIFKKSLGNTKGILSNNTIQKNIRKTNAWLTFEVHANTLADKKQA